MVLSWTKIIVSVIWALRANIANHNRLQVSIYRLNYKGLKEVMPSSVAIFTDAFGPLNSKDVLSLYYESLANNLKRSGHSVTVIYTGKVLSQFSTVSGMYESQGINIIM